jgi:hypothetical protein
MMHIKTKMMNFCLAVLIPLSAAARPPASADCEILVAATVNPDVPFTVTVSRSPAFPGQWFSPTVTVEVVAPVIGATLLGPNSYSQTVTQSFAGLGGANDATATFIIPVFPNLDVTGTVNVFATVSEPVNKRRTRDSSCEAVTAFM